jgi:hypothetical protein
MGQFREEIMTPECHLTGECKYNLPRPLCECAVQNFISIMGQRNSGSFVCWCPEFSAFSANQNAINTSASNSLLVVHLCVGRVRANPGEITAKTLTFLFL